MKNLILTGAVIISTSVFSFAQATAPVSNIPQAANHGKTHSKLKQTPEQFAEQFTQSMEQKIKFAGDQRQKVYDVNVDCFTKLIALRNQDHNVTPEENNVVFKERDSKLKNILNAEQMAIWETMKPNAKRK